MTCYTCLFPSFPWCRCCLQSIVSIPRPRSYIELLAGLMFCCTIFPVCIAAVSIILADSGSAHQGNALTLHRVLIAKLGCAEGPDWPMPVRALEFLWLHTILDVSIWSHSNWGVEEKQGWACSAAGTVTACCLSYPLGAFPFPCRKLNLTQDGIKLWECWTLSFQGLGVLWGSDMLRAKLLGRMLVAADRKADTRKMLQDTTQQVWPTAKCLSTGDQLKVSGLSVQVLLTGPPFSFLQAPILSSGPWLPYSLLLSVQSFSKCIYLCKIHIYNIESIYY